MASRGGAGHGRARPGKVRGSQSRLGNDLQALSQPHTAMEASRPAGSAYWTQEQRDHLQQAASAWRIMFATLRDGQTSEPKRLL